MVNPGDGSAHLHRHASETGLSEEHSDRGLEATLSLEKAVRASGLERNLLELVKTRACQIKGCAFSIDFTKDARALGATEQRLYALSALHRAGARDARMDRGLTTAA
jgi:AhpD family alkylhydroperoxidase